ncbi:phage minor head protein [Acetobacter sp. P1H12_c]|uniref:phage head morphogenesis protein n=1 Tax=Acetobacter sp. P1H12_c TaxID=2762621 RepID=UPI001C040F34|nr:phage minor head protein [Acetobacter sp. P1H12_c]
MADEVIRGVGLAPSDAISFFRQKLNMPSKRWGELEAHAHGTQFAVAGATSKALLDDFRVALNKALVDGTTLTEFRKDFDTIVKRHGWSYNGSPGWRSAIIYETNLTSAYAAGRYKQMTTPEALDIFPYWRYRHHACQHPRPQHVAWDGLILPADDPWWNTHYPPNGWRCHCTVEPVSRRDLKRYNWTVSDAPPLNEKPWRNPATGKTVMVPDGIDPGFQSNPGRDWAMGEKERAATRMTPVIPTGEDAQPARREETQKRQIQEILKVKSGSVEAGTAPEALQEALDVKTDSVLLSGDTLSKNLSRHRDLEAVDYLRLPVLIADPVAIVADTKPTSLVLVSYRGGQHYRMAIKRTKDGTMLFLESFLKFSRERAEALLKSRSALWGDLPPLDADKPKNEEGK